jgi:hypothetical protein
MGKEKLVSTQHLFLPTFYSEKRQTYRKLGRVVICPCAHCVRVHTHTPAQRHAHTLTLTLTLFADPPESQFQPSYRFLHEYLGVCLLRTKICSYVTTVGTQEMNVDIVIIITIVITSAHKKFNVEITI